MMGPDLEDASSAGRFGVVGEGELAMDSEIEFSGVEGAGSGVWGLLASSG
jgi:hypothetical protein